MKKDVAGGMGWIFVAALTSDIRRGRAETASLSSSFIRPSVSSCSSEKFNFWVLLLKHSQELKVFSCYCCYGFDENDFLVVGNYIDN
jgi:hypothetical protein